MGLARPYFDRSIFDSWSHEKMVDAYVGAQTRVVQLEAEVARWRELAKSREEWHGTGQPTPYKPADGQW